MGLEVRIGETFDWVDIPPSAEVRSAGRPVARIVDLSSGRVGEGFATGFLVSPGLLVTNWHVFATPEDTAHSGAHFGYERSDTGIVDGGTVYEIDAERFFLSDSQLDIALVGVAPTPTIGTGRLVDRGTVRLFPSLGKILVGQSVNLIQHPTAGTSTGHFSRTA